MRYSRRKAGIEKTDLRKDGLEGGITGGLLGYHTPETACVLLVYNLLDGHATLGSGFDGIVRPCHALVYNKLTAEITQ